MVQYGDITTQQCVSWSLLPLVVLESVLLLATLWRLAHQVWWKSHPRRIFFHLALVLSCILRCLFWLGLCHPTLFAAGVACLWWSNSLILLCTASIILQWSSAVAAGRVTAHEMQRSKTFGLHHPLVFVHSVHLLSALGGGIDVWLQHPQTTQAIALYATRTAVFLTVFRVVNVVTVAIDSVVAVAVAYQLRKRLLAAAMTDEMKRKSVVQMTVLIVCLLASLLVQTIMDVAVLIVRGGFDDVFDALTLESYSVLKYFAPGVVLSVCFLYIMRRVEQREPARLVLAPSQQSLVEFEECALPCVWCSHHRRFQATAAAAAAVHSTNHSTSTRTDRQHQHQHQHQSQSLNQSSSATHHHHHHKGKWDPTFLSPLTIDSSFRSVQSASAAHNGMFNGCDHPYAAHARMAMPSRQQHSMPLPLPSSSSEQQQQQQQAVAVRFSTVDDMFPHARISPESERQYQQHVRQQQQQQEYYHGGCVRGGAPFS